jgi:hypothetical protein
LAPKFGTKIWYQNLVPKFGTKIWWREKNKHTHHTFIIFAMTLKIGYNKKFFRAARKVKGRLYHHRSSPSASPSCAVFDLTDIPDSPVNIPAYDPNEIIDLVTSSSESEDSEDSEEPEGDEECVGVAFINRRRRTTYAERMLKQLEDTPQWSCKQPRIVMRL